MSVKRKVARVKIEVRKFQRDKERKELRKLALARNKALKESYHAADLAREREALRVAQLKEMKAKGIKPKKGVVEARTKAGKKTGRGIVNALKETRKFMKKHSR